MVGLTSLFKVGGYIRRKVIHQKEWYFENLTDDLLDEFTQAKEGHLPGQPGDRSSEWNNISEAKKDRAPKNLTSAAEDYVEALTTLEKKEIKRVRLAENFIVRFPGGDINGHQIQIYTDVHTVPAGPEHPHQSASLADFDYWLQDVWKAFESAEDSQQLETELRAMANRHEIDSFDQSSLQYWEESLNIHDWGDEFWKYYDRGDLKHYYSNTQDIDNLKEDIKIFAKEMEGCLRVIN